MRKGKHLICPICNKVFFREFRQIKKGTKNSYCSQKCHYADMLIITLEKVTKQYPEPWQELIYQWYIVDKISIREITKKLGISNHTTPKVLKLLNISQRSIHDRIALQWKDNKERKKGFAERTSKLFKGKPSWNKGLNKKTHPSIKRQAEWMIGTNNPMYGKRGKDTPGYKNGKYTAEKKRYWSTSEYQQWRKAVYERDNYACQECGDDKGGNLNAHHIKPWADFPKLRYVVSNGVTLCVKCHRIAHSSIQAEIEHLHLLCNGPASIGS